MYEKLGDLDKATSLYQIACDGGNETGCLNLGFIYSKDEGVLIDLANSVQLLQKACSAGNAGACHRLGLFYENLGEMEEARAFHQKGCDGNHKASCASLGKMSVVTKADTPSEPEQSSPPAM
jgi:TPR repeat protein